MAILNVKTVYSQVLFKIVPNPTIKKKSDSGIFVPAGVSFTDETGEMEKMDQVIGFGIVEAAGPDCKTVKAGDAIFFDRRSVRPVPCGHEVWNVSEQNLIARVDKDDPSLVQAFKEYNAQEEELKSDLEALRLKQEKEKEAKLQNWREQNEQKEASDFAKSLMAK